MSKFSVQVLHIFLGVPSSLNYLVAKLHLINARIHLSHFKTTCFLALFIYLELFESFLHGGSSRILFILELFFKFSLEVMFHQEDKEQAWVTEKHHNSNNP